MKKKKVLVTGSGGFIFGNFIRQAFHTGKPYALSSIDRIRESHILANVYSNKDHSFYIGDITDTHTLKVIVATEEPDIIVHGAAETCVDRGIKTAQPFTKTNVVGTQSVIDACLSRNCKLIYVSTGDVYGSLKTDKDPLSTEDSPLDPRNPYAASKAAGELLVRAAYHTHGLRYNIVRPCNVYGPWQTQEKLIPKIIKNVLGNTPTSLYGQGTQLREWIHVYDVCSAIFKIIDAGVDNEVYNISTNQEFMAIEVFQLVCNTLEKGHDLLKFVEDRKGHDYRYAMTSDKVRKLGWTPEFPKLREGLAQTCQWYLNNKFCLRM